MKKVRECYAKLKLRQILRDDQACWKRDGMITIQDGAGLEYQYMLWRQALKDYCRDRVTAGGKFYTIHGKDFR